jgi:hypothetical protein
MNPFDSVDVFLLDCVFQRLGDGLTAWTGRSCFWFAAQCMAVSPQLAGVGQLLDRKVGAVVAQVRAVTRGNL